MNARTNRLTREVEEFARRLRTAGCVARAVLGVPDYERYLAHVRAIHLHRTPLTREEFVRERLNDRYSRPGTRCC